jgi:hypothetical protein
MFDLIKTGEIDFVIRSEGMALPYLLRLSDVENVKDKFEQAISSHVLAKQLGVDCETIHLLTNAGYLQAKARRAGDGYHTIRFDPDSAEKLLTHCPQLLNCRDSVGLRSGSKTLGLSGSLSLGSF